jgi:carbon-monoxide dehydrogenase medium subunit
MGEALEALEGDEATILAGGQSLLATLNLRLSSPALLVDINGLDELKGISVADGRLRIGALTRHSAIERSPEVAEHTPLVAEAMPHVAHPAIRNRGTVGGSIALADPAAELPACFLALDGRIEIAGAKGKRTVAAADFFRGVFETDLARGELVTAVDIPVIAPAYRSAFAELARRTGDYAMVGLAVHGRVDDGVVSDVRLVYFGVGATPVHAATAAGALEGRRFDGAAESDVRDALGEDLEPFDGIDCSGATKLHLARELAARTLKEFAA